jgi:hypothetical protein
MDNDICEAFKAAFPCFDDYRWAWAYDPNATANTNSRKAAAAFRASV